MAAQNVPFGSEQAQNPQNALQKRSSISAFAFLLAPLLSTSLLVRTLRQAAIAGRWLRFANKLSFVTVGAMVLLLLGGCFLCLAVVQVVPMTVTSLWLPLPLLGMCIAVLVAVSALLGWPLSRERTQARPKDASPSDVDSSQEPRGDRG